MKVIFSSPANKPFSFRGSLLCRIVLRALIGKTLITVADFLTADPGLVMTSEAQEYGSGLVPGTMVQLPGCHSSP